MNTCCLNISSANSCDNNDAKLYWFLTFPLDNVSGVERGIHRSRIRFYLGLQTEEDTSSACCFTEHLLHRGEPPQSTSSSPRRILGISWSVVLTHAQLPRLYARLQWIQFWMMLRHHWLGQRMLDGRNCPSARGRPHLHFNSVCKRDMWAMDIDIERCEDIANDHSRWRLDFIRELERGGGENEPCHRWEACSTEMKTPGERVFTCNQCNRVSV